MNQFIKTLFTLMLFVSSSLYASTLTDKYPSYNYVLSEFDIDSSYAYDNDFETFVLKHDKRYKDLYLLSAKRGEYLMPMIQRQLIEADLTYLLAYLPMIESGFLTNVQSPKKAKGLWQFMPATAKSYDLTISHSYDERNDPVSSTTAAILHLQKLYHRFGKWYLAIMAYNSGEGRVSNAIKRAGTDDLSVLIDEQAKYLPRETREYIKRFLLVTMIGESEVIDFGTSIRKDFNGIVQVEVEGGNDLEKIAEKLKMQPTELLSLNSQYQTNILPLSAKPVTITIPFEKMILFYQNYPPKLEERAHKDHFISHIVSLGETLHSISKRYHSTTDEIMQVNHLKSEALVLESLLIIPVTAKRFNALITDIQP